MTTTPDIPALAEHIIAVWYDTADDAQALRDWAKETDTSLETAIAEDIRDMLHNGNTEDLFDISSLTDDEVEQLSARFHNDWDQLDELSELLATLINTHYPN